MLWGVGVGYWEYTPLTFDSGLYHILMYDMGGIKRPVPCVRTCDLLNTVAIL